MSTLSNHAQQTLFDGQGFAEHQSGQSWSVSYDAHYSCTTKYILIQLCIHSVRKVVMDFITFAENL